MRRGRRTSSFLRGRCTLIIEGVERQLAAWDFIHCPPRTRHALVAAGDEPAFVLAVGARIQKGSARYPVDQLAISYGAGVPDERTSPERAYERFGPSAPGSAPELPW